MLNKIILFISLFACAIAEAPLSGPYPPSGWKPKGAPFTLPREFLPRTQAGSAEVEVSKERVEYAGQLNDATTTIQPRNDYLPPEDSDNPEDNSSDDFLKVQRLPSNDPSSFKPPQSVQFNRGEYSPPTNNQYRTQNNRQFGQVRQQTTNGRKQQQFSQDEQQFRGFQPQTYQAPQFGQFNQQPQFGNPAQEYGPPPQPRNGDNNPDTKNDDDEENSTETNDDDSQEDGQPAVAVANSISKGRYYVLTPDNTLQRVVFMTTQDSEEARTNGFTARLRYMPVEPIRDPIYAYNEQGQLIRIFKK